MVDVKNVLIFIDKIKLQKSKESAVQLTFEYLRVEVIEVEWIVIRIVTRILIL